jgi:hypothetical protein
VAQVGERAANVFGHLADSVQSAKQHTTSLYVRASDPALLTGGPRPGTAAIAVAGALAVGGGTYGAHRAVSAPSPAPGPAASAQHVPSASSAPSVGRPTPRRPAPRRRSTTRPRRLEPPPPIAAPTPSTAVQPTQPSPTPPQPVPTPPQPSQPTEFGFED